MEVSGSFLILCCLAQVKAGTNWVHKKALVILLRLLKMQESKWIWASISDIFGILHINFSHSAAEYCMVELLKGRTWESPGQALPYTYGVLHKG